MLPFMYSYSCQILIKIKCSRNMFEKIFKYQILWMSFQWGPSFSMRTEGQTDMTEIIVAFRTFRRLLKSKDIKYFRKNLHTIQYIITIHYVSEVSSSSTFHFYRFQYIKMQVLRLSAGRYSCQNLHVSIYYFQSCKRFYHLTGNLETNFRAHVVSPHWNLWWYWLDINQGAPQNL